MMKVSTRYKVVIDTNIFISFLIGRHLKDLPKYLNLNIVELIISEELISEIIEVTARPKLHRYFSRENVEELLLLIEEKSTVILPTTKTDSCRDSKDNYLLSLAIDGKADLLITGDEDLLSLKSLKDTKIISYSTFEKLIKDVMI